MYGRKREIVDIYLDLVIHGSSTGCHCADLSPNDTSTNHSRGCVHPNVLHEFRGFAHRRELHGWNLPWGRFFLPSWDAYSTRVHHAIYLNLCKKEAEGCPLWS